MSEIENPWALRPYNAESLSEREAMHYLLGVSYCRSRAGIRAGASRAGKKSDVPEAELVARQKAFLAAHTPIWDWLLRHADVTLAVDSERPWIIHGWCITSGPTVLHAIGIKRVVIEAGPDIARDLIAELLGDRLRKHQVCTLELPQMRVKGDAAIGIDRPREWSMDPTWLLTRMVGR